jgi:hypothetical protein
VNAIRALWFLLALGFPCTHLLQLCHLPEQRVIIPLEPSYFADRLLNIGIMRFEMGRLDLLQMLGRVPEGQQWRRLQPALL